MNEDNNTLTVANIMEQIAEAMCNNYCKFPSIWNEEEEGMELCESDICKNCPLNRLV